MGYLCNTPLSHDLEIVSEKETERWLEPRVVDDYEERVFQHCSIVGHMNSEWW